MGARNAGAGVCEPAVQIEGVGGSISHIDGEDNLRDGGELGGDEVGEGFECGAGMAAAQVPRVRRKRAQQNRRCGFRVFQPVRPLIEDKEGDQLAALETQHAVVGGSLRFDCDALHGVTREVQHLLGQAVALDGGVMFGGVVGQFHGAHGK